MPVRSSNSSVLKWPELESVVDALRKWNIRIRNSCPGFLRAGYFGSYARGTWGFGSDLDLVIILKSSNKAFIERTAGLYPDECPVPVDLLVYTEKEWIETMKNKKQFRDVIWIS